MIGAKPQAVHVVNELCSHLFRAIDGLSTDIHGSSMDDQVMELQTKHYSHAMSRTFAQSLILAGLAAQRLLTQVVSKACHTQPFLKATVVFWFQF